MSSLEIIENKISYIQKHLATAKKYQSYTLKDLEQNDLIRGAVERELYIIAQAVIDLAEAVIAY